jgi:hypothetical protein
MKKGAQLKTHGFVWVTQGRREHHAVLLEPITVDCDTVLIRWSTMTTTERVSVSSVRMDQEGSRRCCQRERATGLIPNYSNGEDTTTSGAPAIIDLTEDEEESGAPTVIDPTEKPLIVLEEVDELKSDRDLRRHRKVLAKRRRTMFFSQLALLQVQKPKFAHKLWLSSFQKSNFALQDDYILERILAYLHERELVLAAGLVSTKWFEVATTSHANLLLARLLCDNQDCDSSSNFLAESNRKMSLIERNWDYLTTNFPWACFLAEGGYKKVYKVFNKKLNVEEAVSVM